MFNPFYRVKFTMLEEGEDPTTTPLPPEADHRLLGWLLMALIVLGMGGIVVWYLL